MIVGGCRCNGDGKSGNIVFEVYVGQRVEDSDEVKFVLIPIPAITKSTSGIYKTLHTA